MKSSRWVLLPMLIGVTILSACGGISGTPEAIPTVVLSSNGGNSQSISTETVAASAIIVPVNQIQLSFPLTGSVATVDVAEGDLVESGQSLVQLDTAILQAIVAEREANIIAAQTQVSYLRRIINSSNEDIDAAEAEVARQNAILDADLERLNQATLVAPISGTVVSVDISPGETVTPGLIVITIGDLTEMQIETTDLSERDIPKVKIGQSATINIDALDQEVNGRVSRIAEQASSVGGDVVYTVIISLDEEIPEARWGMSAEIKIAVEG